MMEASFLDPGSHEEHEVSLDEFTLIEVARDKNAETVQVTTVQGKASKELRTGQFVLGASIGSATLSFVRMPERLVRAELKRLRDARTPYKLVVSEGFHQDKSLLKGSSLEGSFLDNRYTTLITEEERKESESHPLFKYEAPPISASSTPKRALDFNPQEFTPSVSDTLGVDSFVRKSQTVTSKPPKPEFNKNMSEAEIQKRAGQSLARLRKQRVVMDRLKGEVDRKTMENAGLKETVEGLEKQLRTAEEQIQGQNAMKSELASALEKIELLESRLVSKDQEAEVNRTKSKAMEDLLRSSLHQEKEKNEKERIARSQETSELKRQLAVEKAAKFNFHIQNQELTSEVHVLKTNLAKEKAHLKQMMSTHEERVAALGREISSLKSQEQQARDKVKQIERTVEQLQETVRVTQASLNASNERERQMKRNVSELEQLNKTLRSQMANLERKRVMEVEALQRKVHNLSDELSQKITAFEKQEAQLFRVQRRLDTETKAKNDATNLVIQRELELSNANSLVDRSQQQLARYEKQIKESNIRMEDLHKKMLAEMAKSEHLQQQLENSNTQYQDWARSRMNLLEKFCEEESLFGSYSP